MGWQGRGTLVVRQWQLLVLLRERPRTLQALARVLGVCPRTVRRDLDALSVLFPITNLNGRGKSAGTVYALAGMPEWPRQAVSPVRSLRA